MPKNSIRFNKRRARNVLLVSMLIIGSYFFVFLHLGLYEKSQSAKVSEKEEVQGEKASLSTVEASIENDIKEPDGLYAQSAVLLDADSGRVLFEKNGMQERPMASTTKIMTCILALEYGKLDDVVIASKNASNQPKVHLGVVEGEQIILRDLLYSLMLESHNDAAVMIAEQVGGSVEEFADMMNRKAWNLGCKNTYFITPNGLDASDENGNHRTTAEDLARIMKYCIQDSTQAKQFLSICQTKTYTFEDCSHVYKYSCYNHNAFLEMMDGAIAGKTGFTNEAGYCYVGALEKDRKKFVVALLACGWPNHKGYKWSDTKILMNYGLNSFEYVTLNENNVRKQLESYRIPVVYGIPDQGKMSGPSYAEVQIKDVQNEDNINLTESKRVLVRKDKKIKENIVVVKQLYAPTEIGDKVGEVQYILDDIVIKRQKLVVKEKIGKRSYEWCLRKTGENFLL